MPDIEEEDDQMEDDGDEEAAVVSDADSDFADCERHPGIFHVNRRDVSVFSTAFMSLLCFFEMWGHYMGAVSLKL